MGISQETVVVGTVKEMERSMWHLSDKRELKGQNTQASSSWSRNIQKVESVVYSAGFVYIVLGDRTVDILKSDTHIYAHMLKHGEKKKC